MSRKMASSDWARLRSYPPPLGSVNGAHCAKKAGDKKKSDS